MSPKETPWTQVSLENIRNVDNLKAAIKNRMAPKLDMYAIPDLVLKAKKSSEDNEEAVELTDPRELITSVQRQFYDDFEVLVFTPDGMYPYVLLSLLQLST